MIIVTVEIKDERVGFGGRNVDHLHRVFYDRQNKEVIPWVHGLFDHFGQVAWSYEKRVTAYTCPRCRVRLL